MLQCIEIYFHFDTLTCCIFYHRVRMSHCSLSDRINGCVNAKKPKLSKAGSSSKDAYMLVYRQRGEGKLLHTRLVMKTSQIAKV